MERISREQFYANLLIQEKGLDDRIDSLTKALNVIITNRNKLTRTRFDIDRITGSGMRVIFFEDDEGMRYEVEPRDCGFLTPKG